MEQVLASRLKGVLYGAREQALKLFRGMTVKQEGSQGTKRAILMLRWMVLLTLTLFMIYAGRGMHFWNLVLLALLLTCYAASNIWVTVSRLARFDQAWQNLVLFIFDTAVITLAILLLRKFDTDLYLAYFLLIFMVAIGRNLLENLLIAGVVSGVYALMVLHSTGIMSQSLMETTFLIRIPFIFVLTIFYSFLMEQERGFRKQSENSRQLSEKLTREVKMAQVRLDRTQRMATLGEILHGMAESVNDSLTLMVREAEKFQQEYLGPEGRMLAADNIIREGTQCQVMVKRTISLSVNNEPGLETLDINLCLRRSIQIVQNILTMHGIKLVFEPALDLPPVRCDELKMQQVFLNLIHNAAQAISLVQKDGIIEIRTSLAADHLGEDKVQISVKDRGPGIAEEIRGRIFEPFFTTKTAERAAGLGLSICREIVEAHKGHIFYKTSQEQGTIFYIHLPVGRSGVSGKSYQPGDADEKGRMLAGIFEATCCQEKEKQ